MASATERTMTNTAATALEEIRKRHDEVETNYGDEPWDENCIEDGEAAHKDRATLITHIAALEAEYAECRKLLLGEMAKNVCKAEAQLATSLPDDPETDGTDAAHPAWWRGQERGVDGAAQSILNVIAKGRADGTAGSKLLQQAREQVVALLSGAATAEQSFDGTIHPDGTPNQVTASTWLSGAATPAPTAALTEEELLTPELIKKAADAGERVGWDDVLTPNAQIYHRAIDLKKYETALRAVLPIIIDRLAKSPPQGAKE